MSEKLDSLIHKHQEDWDKLAEQLELLSAEVIAGRGKKSDERIEAPFQDLIADMAFSGSPMADEEIKTLK